MNTERNYGRRKVTAKHVILEAGVMAGATRITLTSGSTEQLTVNAGGRIAFRSDHMKASQLTDTFRDLDICTAACHIRSHGNGPKLSSFGNDICFIITTNRINDPTEQSLFCKLLTQDFTFINVLSSDQDGATDLMYSDNFVDNCLTLVFLG